MKVIARLSPDDLARATERLRNPEPGSKAAAARDFGIDLSLVAEQLRLTPAERARRMHGLCQMAEAVRGTAAKGKP